jgi:hypothetical protein
MEARGWWEKNASPESAYESLMSIYQDAIDLNEK